VQFTENGLIDSDGVEREYDAIICATGFDTSLNSSSTPFIGRNGVTLSQVWDPDPVNYIGICPPEMPNLFTLFGPGSSPFAGSIVHTFEGCTHYIIKCVQKIQQEYLKSMVCKQQALDNFYRHLDRHMAKTVYSAHCPTWFKRNKPDGRSIISWPGSAMHGYFGWKNPRFEDFDYTSWLPEDDTMAWLGNGNTVAEFTDVGDSTLYMDYDDVSKVLPVPTKDYQPPQIWKPIAANGDLLAKQHISSGNIDTSLVSNLAVDLNAPADTRLAASQESAILRSLIDTGSAASGKPKAKKFY